LLVFCKPLSGIKKSRFLGRPAIILRDVVPYAVG
jgi:hypothetical protein